MSYAIPVLGRLAVAALLASSVSAQPAEPCRPFFNGVDLAGWKHVGPGGFVVEDGALKTDGGMGLLWYTRERVSNVTLRVVYRNPGGANSGIFVRIPEEPTEPWMPVNRGYEVQIDDHADDFHRTGVLYSLTRALAKPEVGDNWKTMEITLDGDRTTVHVDGLLVTDHREGDAVPPKREDWEPDRGPRPKAGYIGLQNHGAEDTVYFREVCVSPLER